MGFADLQHDGYIDQFFVHPAASGRGVGSRLMETLVAQAQRKPLNQLCANVSHTAAPFFQRHGVVPVLRQQLVLRGVTFVNTRMRRSPV